MKQSLLLLIVLLITSCYAQNIVVDGIEYKVHKVKKKETAFGIARQYNLTVDQLTKYNPSIEKGLQKGMELRIPTTPSIVKEKETKEPVKSNEHLVQAGETLYSISKKYGVGVDELVKLNPGNTQNLAIGTRLLIPSSTSEETKVVTNPSPVVSGNKHVVKAGETVYSICEQYNLTMEEFKRLNPGVGLSLSIGQEVQVLPAKVNANNPFNKTKEITIQHIVEPGETAYSIARTYETTIESLTNNNPSISIQNLKVGDVLSITTKPLLMSKSDTRIKEITKGKPTDTASIVKKESYNVSLLLPLMLDKNASIQAARKPNDPKKMYGDTELSIQFFNGVKIALDTLQKAGVSLNLNVFDTKKDTSFLTNLFKRQELKESDLLIGPFYESAIDKAVVFAKNNKVQLVCPTDQPNKILFNNPYVTKLSPSLPAQAQYLAAYIANKYNDQNVVLIEGKSKQDKYLVELITKIFNDSIKGKSNNYKANITVYTFTSYKEMYGLDSKLVSDRKNILLFPSTDVGLATSFFTQFNILMNKRAMDKVEVKIYALENFKKYDNIEIEHRIKYHLHVTSSYFIDYANPGVKDFILKYREKFGTEPNDFAYMGYDAMVYNGLALKYFGKNHSGFYENIQIPLLHTTYDLKQKSEGNGYENQFIYILSYDNYQLNRVN